jgi:Na+/H+ antiporter NhaD/arsenite permease-like protein
MVHLGHRFLKWCLTFRASSKQFLGHIVAHALASNIGETATLIGDPPNIMIGSAANIDFNSFLIHMGPTVAVIFVSHYSFSNCYSGRT